MGLNRVGDFLRKSRSLEERPGSVSAKLTATFGESRPPERTTGSRGETLPAQPPFPRTSHPLRNAMLGFSPASVPLRKWMWRLRRVWQSQSRCEACRELPFETGKAKRCPEGTAHSTADVNDPSSEHFLWGIGNGVESARPAFTRRADSTPFTIPSLLRCTHAGVLRVAAPAGPAGERLVAGVDADQLAVLRPNVNAAVCHCRLET